MFIPEWSVRRLHACNIFSQRASLASSSLVRRAEVASQMEGGQDRVAEIVPWNHLPVFGLLY